MGGQATATKDNAAAARASADALLNIERAWVDIRLTKQGPAVYFLEIANYGRTVAKVKEYTLTPTLSPSQATSEAKYLCNKLLVPNVPWNPVILNLPRDLGNDIYQRIRTGEVKLSYHAVVRYASITDSHESECRYWYNSASNYDCLLPVEAPEYNNRT